MWLVCVWGGWVLVGVGGVVLAGVPVPKPRGRVRDKALLAASGRWPAQLVGGAVNAPPVDRTVTHHLCCRHDERGNLFRLPDSVHRQFHDGPDRLGAARRIRGALSLRQVAYIKGERGEGWLDATYPL